MSVLITGMEMPTSCDWCWALDDYGDYPRCRITNEQRGYNFPVREQRMGKCPLVHVPPHGWIPVTERLPVYILDGEPLANMYLCYHVSEPMSWYQIDWWDGEKFVFKRQGRNDRVTHWMKPPAPPKEEHT